MKFYHFSLGNSAVGPIGFCAVVWAASPADAVRILREQLPDEIGVDPISDDGDADAVDYIRVYTNADAITEKDIIGRDADDNDDDADADPEAGDPKYAAFEESRECGDGGHLHTTPESAADCRAAHKRGER